MILPSVNFTAGDQPLLVAFSACHRALKKKNHRVLAMLHLSAQIKLLEKKVMKNLVHLLSTSSKGCGI